MHDQFVLKCMRNDLWLMTNCNKGYMHQQWIILTILSYFDIKILLDTVNIFSIHQGTVSCLIVNQFTWVGVAPILVPIYWQCSRPTWDTIIIFCMIYQGRHQMLTFKYAAASVGYTAVCCYVKLWSNSGYLRILNEKVNQDLKREKKYVSLFKIPALALFEKNFLNF